MINKKNKISIAISQDINAKLEENSINKSKLINSLIKKFLDKDKDFTKFVKKCHK